MFVSDLRGVNWLSTTNDRALFAMFAMSNLKGRGEERTHVTCHI